MSVVSWASALLYLPTHTQSDLCCCFSYICYSFARYYSDSFVRYQTTLVNYLLEKSNLIYNKNKCCHAKLTHFPSVPIRQTKNLRHVPYNHHAESQLFI